MEYTLYTQTTCKSCEGIIQCLNSKGIEYNIVNLDIHPDQKPEGLFIVPALYQMNNLIAYGKDILNQFCA